MNKKKVLVFGMILFVAALVVLAFVFFSDNKSGNFSKTSLIRLNIPSGGEVNTSVIILNNEKNPENFKVSLNNFKGLAELSDSNFMLEPQSSKEIIISFDDSKYQAGVYVGKMIIEGSQKIDEIPIILGVEDPNRAFAIIQSSIPKYDSVFSGGKLGVEIKVFDFINTGAPTADADYYIKNLDDETILHGTTELVVGGSKSEIIDVPSSWAEGDYVFVLYINYKDTTSISSYLFSISNERDSVLFGDLRIFVFLVIVFVVLILGMVIYFVKTRDSLIVELRAQQARELNRNLQYIECYKKDIQRAKESAESKKKKINLINNAKKNLIKRIKSKQKKQHEELRKLRKENKPKDKLKERIENWKKDGYKMFESENELKKISKKGISEQVNDWKRKGYDTSFIK